MLNKSKIITAALKGIYKGSTTLAATSILTGVALAEIPIIFLGLVTVGTSTVIAWPIFISALVIGGVLGGLMGAFFAYREEVKTQQSFEALLCGA